ncbi:MAG: addiction module protein [Gemmatimonadetes bacterium]|nr:addiction module protein [Gemmatimonadota bacterium]MCH8254032.1 addiction module protein [Gemmatimonadota bacterium]MCH8936365.1 addiction module protein [Gemmatimonadota bacterium]
MDHPIDISRLTPQERIELAEDLWDSLTEEDIELTDDQLAELERRRDRLDRDGPRGRPWRQVFERRSGFPLLSAIFEKLAFDDSHTSCIT